MVFWSCTLYQLNPECQRDVFLDLWNDKNVEYDYDMHDGNSMYIYVNDILENSWGQLNELQIDVLSEPYTSRRNPTPQRFIMTNNIALQIFDIGTRPTLLGVFGAQGNVSKFNNGVRNIFCRRTNDKISPLIPIIFNLHGQEDCLTRQFPNMRALSVDQIRSLHVRDATIRGTELENSPYYEAWVLNSDSRGVISYFGLNVLQETIHVGTYGTLYSRTGQEHRPVHKVSIIIERFLNCNALLYQPDITMFTQ